MPDVGRFLFRRPTGGKPRGGKLTEPADIFAHPLWGIIRDQVANKAADMRHQGFFSAAILPISELEYTGIMETLMAVDTRFRVRRD